MSETEDLKVFGFEFTNAQKFVDEAIKRTLSAPVQYLPLNFFYTLVQNVFISYRTQDDLFVGYVEYGLRVLKERADNKNLSIF
jgi:hypothetical protein